MATKSGRTPRKLKDAGDYTAIGKVGRKTGAVLKDTGVRDEHGMEPIPSFSSPQRLPIDTNGTYAEQDDETYTGDQTMEISNETFDVSRSASNARRSIPRSISPRKINMGGTPRRDPGILSSPSKSIQRASPSPSPTKPPPNRQLDFSMGPPQTNGGLSPRKKPPRTATVPKKGKNKRPFDLSMTEDDVDTPEDADQDVGMSDAQDYNAPIINGDDTGIFDDGGDHDINLHDSIEVGESGGDFDSEADVAPGPEQAPKTAQSTPKTKRGRPAKNANDTSIMELPALQESASSKRRKPGRPPKIAKIYKDANESAPEQKPVKDASKSSKEPKERDPNVGAKSKLSKTLPTSKTSTSRAASIGPSTSRIRYETPATDAGSFTTRSGRVVFKPLATWRGEKAVYGQRPDRDTLAPLTDIIRTDEILMPPPARKKARKARGRSELADIEENTDNLEPWETDTGIMHAQVMQWNQETGKYDEDEVEESEVAYAANAIEMRDIAGADFKFAKTLTLPFFGSGMVHLPPGGVKRVKNSRKMQMVFFVHQGRVTVDVGTPTTTFSIGRGGQWQVPRGNFYSISNESEYKDARIFFAQGCEWQGDIGEESVNA